MVTTLVLTERVDVTLYMVHNMSYIKWVCCHTHNCSEIIRSGCDDTDTVDAVLDIVGVMT